VLIPGGIQEMLEYFTHAMTRDERGALESLFVLSKTHPPRAVLCLRRFVAASGSALSKRIAQLAVKTLHLSLLVGGENPRVRCGLKVVAENQAQTGSWS
jgi:hypothetical protein